MAPTAAVAGPLAAASRTSWTAHMAGHLLLGMLAPLLLVLGAPVTLALRALPVAAARRPSRVLRSRPLRVLTEPVLGVLVHAHVLLSGYLFTAVWSAAYGPRR